AARRGTALYAGAELLCAGHNLIEILEPGVTWRSSLRLRDEDIARVLDLMAERSKLFVQTSVANCAWPHVYTTTVGAQIHRRADQANLHGVLCCSKTPLAHAPVRSEAGAIACQHRTQSWCGTAP